MKKLVDKIKKFGVIEFIVFVIYIIFILVVATNHECYEDETQSWLIARDLSLVDIIKQMKYEGHSFLWYYLLFPFAKLGFPVGIQNYISSLFGIGTVYLILKKSPFNKFTKVLLTFSGGLIFFYSVIARPYCMIPFLLACIATIYKDKREHPYLYAIMIALLANTHLMMIPTAILLVFFFCVEELLINREIQTEESTKKLCRSFLIAIFGIVVYVLIAIFTYGNCAIIENFDESSSLKNIDKFIDLIQKTFSKSIDFLYGSRETTLWYKIIVGFVLGLCVIGSIRSIKQAIIFWSQLLFTFLIHTLAWFILPTRIFITIYTLMFWGWTYKFDRQYLKKQKRDFWVEIALIILIIISIPSAWKLAIQDISENYSTGKNMAEFIKVNVPEGSCLVFANNELQQSFLAYLKKDSYKLYMPNSKEFVTYTTWNDEWNAMIYGKDIAEAVKNMKNQFEKVYIVSQNQTISHDKALYGLTLLYNTKDEIMDNFYNRYEVFYIYEVNYK